jgi:hypothetical protein
MIEVCIYHLDIPRECAVSQQDELNLALGRMMLLAQVEKIQPCSVPWQGLRILQ